MSKQMTIDEARAVVAAWDARKTHGACLSCGAAADACRCGDYVDGGAVPAEVNAALDVLYPRATGNIFEL